MRECKHMGPKKWIIYIYTCIYIFFSNGDFDFPVHALWLFLHFFSWITDAHMFQRDLKEENGEMS